MSDQITRGFHFTMLSDCVIDDERVGRKELLVYTVLCRYAGKERTAFPSIPTIATKARLSERTVQEAIKGLQELGYLHVERRKRDDGTNGNKSNLYTVTDTPGAMVAPPSRNGCTTPGAVVAPEVDTLEVDTKKEGESGTPKGEDVAKQPPPDVFHTRVEELVNEVAPGTSINQDTRKAINEFGEIHGDDVLDTVVADYLKEKERTKVRRFINDDMPAYLADYTLDHLPKAEKPTCRACGQYYDGDDICADCADVKRTRDEDEKRRIEHPEDYEDVSCAQCGADVMRMSLRDGMCFSCWVSAKKQALATD